MRNISLIVLEKINGLILSFISECLVEGISYHYMVAFYLNTSLLHTIYYYTSTTLAVSPDACDVT